MALCDYNSLKKTITRRTQEQWLQRAIKACNGETALFQRIIRLIWWDVIQFMNGDMLKAQIDDNFYDIDDIPEKQVASALKRSGYPEQIALQRSHNPEQKRYLKGGGRPRKQPPEDE